MRISPKPPGNTVQEKTTKPLQKGSGYDNCTLSYPTTDPVLSFAATWMHSRWNSSTVTWIQRPPLKSS